MAAAMVVSFVGGLAVCDFAEAATARQLANLHVTGVPEARHGSSQSTPL
jgi:hypothetical protein